MFAQLSLWVDNRLSVECIFLCLRESSRCVGRSFSRFCPAICGLESASWKPNFPKSWESPRSEEHTSELQSPCNLVCRLLLEKQHTRTHRTQRATPVTSQRRCVHRRDHS